MGPTAPSFKYWEKIGDGFCKACDEEKYDCAEMDMGEAKYYQKDNFDLAGCYDEAEKRWRRDGNIIGFSYISAEDTAEGDPECRLHTGEKDLGADNEGWSEVISPTYDGAIRSSSGPSDNGGSSVCYVADPTRPLEPATDSPTAKGMTASPSAAPAPKGESTDAPTLSPTEKKKSDKITPTDIGLFVGSVVLFCGFCFLYYWNYIRYREDEALLKYVGMDDLDLPRSINPDGQDDLDISGGRRESEERERVNYLPPDAETGLLSAE